jgi:hypothetical protein
MRPDRLLAAILSAKLLFSIVSAAPNEVVPENGLQNQKESSIEIRRRKDQERENRRRQQEIDREERRQYEAKERERRRREREMSR